MTPLTEWLLTEAYPALVREMNRLLAEERRLNELNRRCGEAYRKAESEWNSAKETVHALGWLIARSGVSWDIINAAKDRAELPPLPAPRDVDGESVVRL